MENIRRQPTGLYIAPPQPRVMQPQQEVLPQRESIAKAIEFEKEPSQKSMRSLLQQLIEEKEHGDKKAETERSKKGFKFPAKWRSAARRSQKKDQVLVFYLNIKGELEAPKVVPLYSGHMIILKNKVHEVDPRSLWTTKIGPKIYKLLIVREIDRRPVSNLDWDEVRRRGDATDSDEYLIKAALKAQIGAAKKPISKGAMIVIGLLAAAALILLFTVG